MEITADKTTDNYKVPNLEKGLLILEVLSSSRKAMTLHEIKTEVDISQTTAYRILHTLLKHGYVLHDEASHKYKLSRKMLTLGFKAIHEQSILEVVLPKMRELRDHVKETVCFGVMGEEKGIFVEQVLGTYPFCFVLTPGKLLELHCSAPGKAMMAFLPENTRNSYLAKMNYEMYNDNTIRDESSYLDELVLVREQGYALDMEEELHGVVCVGAPIFNYSNAPCGALWFSGPRDRLPGDKIVQYSILLKEVTRTLSFELGFTREAE